MAFVKTYGEFLNESLNEESRHEGWIVVGFDKKTRKAEILSIPLIRKEAVRFLQSFENTMHKMAEKLRKYSKFKIVHASDVFEKETYIFEDVEYSIIDNRLNESEERAGKIKDQLNKANDSLKQLKEKIKTLRDKGADASKIDQLKVKEGKIKSEIEKLEQQKEKFTVDPHDGKVVKTILKSFSNIDNTDKWIGLLGILDDDAEEDFHLYSWYMDDPDEYHDDFGGNNEKDWLKDQIKAFKGYVDVYSKPDSEYSSEWKKFVSTAKRRNLI